MERRRFKRSEALNYGHTRRSPADYRQAHRAAGRLRRGVCGARHQLLVPPDRRKRQVRGDGREQPPADARAARAAWRSCTTATGRCSSRTAIPSRSPSSASTPRISTAPSRLLSAVAGLDPNEVRGDRRAASQRAELSADRGRRGRVAGAGGGDHGAASRLRTARRRRRGSADAPVPRRRRGGAPVRLCRRSERRAWWPPTTSSRAAISSARRASRRSTTRS